MDFKSTTIKTKLLVLDKDNPRFFEHQDKVNKLDHTDQEQLMKLMEADSDIPSLLKGIRKSGVTDPIWVKEMDDGKYLVIEGNRRTYILKKLIQETKNPPHGIRYDEVKANVYPASASEKELLLQRSRLQTGKKGWGAFNQAATIYRLRYIMNYEEEDIAEEVLLSTKKVRDMIKYYKMFLSYSKETGDKTVGAEKFSTFYTAPVKVKSWIDEGNEEKFFEWIKPNDLGITKIRSASTRGGVRDFAKILDVPKTLRKFMEEPDLTCEDAINEVGLGDIKMEIPIFKKISQLAGELNALEQDDVERVTQDKQLQRNIRRLKKAIETFDNRAAKFVD